jgi:hypothetical protein
LLIRIGVLHQKRMIGWSTSRTSHSSVANTNSTPC